LGFNDRVIFTGFREDIPEIMAALDIFVSPTLYKEGLSRSILEAMASSKPVITTCLGGNPEVVVDGVTGILIPPKNSLKLADAISELTKDMNRRKDMGKAGRKRIEQLFTIEEATKKTEEIYEELLCPNI
jgi:glycosyltransferase involved in cell wall biosynthesis